MKIMNMGYAPNWTPAYAPAAGRSSLAQTPPVYPDTGFERFMSSPTLALATDVTAVGMSGYVAYHLGKINSGWSTFWWVVMAAAVMKGLHDYKRINS